MNKILFAFLALTFTVSVFGQASMRRCTLLPVTDSVGGAIGYKVFEELELQLKKGNWCTYVSNSGMLNVFSKYRENLPQYLKTKPVIKAVADKLKVGSIIRVAIVNELSGVELQLDVYGEDGEDLYFSEIINLQSDDIDSINSAAKTWLDTYSKTIPYDAKINGILGDQITLDVGKGYPIQVGQKFIVKRQVTKKKHPLFKKIVDWDTEVLAEGKVFNISDNQALGMVKSYRGGKHLASGDWVRLEEMKITDTPLKPDQDANPEGTLGILSVAFFGSLASTDTSTPTGSKRINGRVYGLNLKGEGWITRELFATVEISRSTGSLKKSSGNIEQDSVDATYGTTKLFGGYKYLPLGLFYGPQINFYGGYVRHSFDLNLSSNDGFGANAISGLMMGTMANIPLNRDYRLIAKAEFLPFPAFKDEDGIYGNSSNVTALELEIGLKYQYTRRMTLDGSIESQARKAKFAGGFREISYQDNLLKLGVAFNF
ncbi:MAG TPA: hypothetical protein VNJ01_14330 [Bacteriovoracaceae bacterium]|nr:hypothetical protein [Bacteriovoracaceae bacterium]